VRVIERRIKLHSTFSRGSMQRLLSWLREVSLRGPQARPPPPKITPEMERWVGFGGGLLLRSIGSYGKLSSPRGAGVDGMLAEQR
jgi:hypothetical protein